MSINKKNISELRKKYPVFCYESFDFKIRDNRLDISFLFKAGKIEFSPKLTIIGDSPIKISKANLKALENLIFNLGIIESFSYWKAFCSPQISIKAGYLDAQQIGWWEDLLLNGMGQYFYENKIDFTKNDFIKIVSESENISYPIFALNPKKEEILLPIGGGKDSATSIEICKRTGKKVVPFILNTNASTKNMIKAAGLSSSIICKRNIEEKLLKLNRSGYLNGHTPFVAYLSFLGLIASASFNKKYLIFSNEKSSNEGNVFFKEREINHQYSKAFDFEKKFRNYSKKYLISDFEYFSLLRPLYELQISRIFSKNEQYFKVFLSCNEAQKTYSGTREKLGNWCGNCSKCLFVYIVLAPFLKKADLISIFGKDLFADKNLIPVMAELVDEDKVKPLECVGTKKECLVALYLSWKNNNVLGLKQPELLANFEAKTMPKHKNLEKEVDKILNNWDKNNFVPEEWKKYFEL